VTNYKDIPLLLLSYNIYTNIKRGAIDLAIFIQQLVMPDHQGTLL